MAKPHLLKVPKQSDRRVIDLLREIALENQVPSVAVSVGAAGAFQVRTDGALPDEAKTLLDLDSSLIETASVNVPGFSISFYRGGYPSQGHVRSAIFDEVVFTYDQQQAAISELRRLQLIGNVAKSMRAFEPDRAVSSGLSDEQNQLIALHNSTLERLEGLNVELVRGSEQFRRNLENDFRQRSDDLESGFRKRLEDLENGFNERKATLDQKELAFDQKLKEIDDRQNTHVRREIRKDILNEVRARSQEFRLTKGTNRLRMPVHVLCILLLSLLGIANAYYAQELTLALKSDNAQIAGWVILGVKQLLLSLAFGATAIFYIRWLNAWFAEHAEAEFNLRRFQLDIERASWVVESALEWKDAKAGNMPRELLDPITRNLFSGSAEPKTDLHPADELASALFGTAAKVKLKVADSEVELDGKKLKQLHD